jgi:HNH endonuclease
MLNWKGGKVVNSRGYILVLNHEHPFSDKDGYVKEHRLVWELHNNAILLPHPLGIVHHINGDKKDNRIENLEAMSKYKHDSLHSKHRGRGQGMKPKSV